MIAKCPYCNAEMEGDAVIGDLIECPICQATFTLEQKYVIPEVAVPQVATSSGRASRQRAFRSENNGIDRYLTCERRTRRFEHMPALIIVGVLLAAGGVFAWRADSPWKVSLPWSKLHRATGPAIEGVGSVHSSRNNTQKPLRKREGARSAKGGKRNLTEAERVFKEALDALLGENGEQRDIVKAYRKFIMARELKYDMAEAAIAHLHWTMTDEDRKAFELVGEEPPRKSYWYSPYPYAPGLHSPPRWVMQSRLALFEQGIYQLTLDWEERNEEGLNFILQSAKEGLPSAIWAVNTFVAKPMSQHGFSASEMPLIVHLNMKNSEVLSGCQKMCELELKREFLLSLGLEVD